MVHWYNGVEYINIGNNVPTQKREIPQLKCLTLKIETFWLLPIHNIGHIMSINNKHCEVSKL